MNMVLRWAVSTLECNGLDHHSGSGLGAQSAQLRRDTAGAVSRDGGVGGMMIEASSTAVFQISDHSP